MRALVMLARPLAAAIVFVAALAGCDDAQGIVKIHFLLRPPRVYTVDADAGPPPVDLIDVSHAAGSVEAFVDLGHLSVEMTGLPEPADPTLGYELWLSPAESGGAWVAVDEVVPRPGGGGAVHHDQADVPIDLATVRSALVTLGERGDDEPSRFVVLDGGVGRDPETTTTAPASPGHTHEH